MSGVLGSTFVLVLFRNVDVIDQVSFLDALASFGSMLESGSVIHVFEILSNLGHIFRLSLE